jgi:predicted HD phosphohydrolase
MQRIFIENCFLFSLGSVSRVKRFHLGGKRFADDEEVETEVWKRLRQQSKDFYAVSFDTVVKRWDKCINVGGGYVEK